MQLIKTDSSSLLISCAICLSVFLTGCSSAPTKDDEKAVAAMPGNAPANANSVGEGRCKTEDETGAKVCITPLEPVMNCRKSTDQLLYKTCQVEVSYTIENESERPVSVKAECQAGLEYKNKYGWQENSKTDSYRHTLSPQETVSRTFHLDSKFGQHRKVKEVKMGPVECSIVSVSSANDASEGNCKIEDLSSVKVCVKEVQPVLNCLKSSNQSVYKACQIEVSYNIENKSDQSASVQTECQAELEYKGKSGWEENSQTGSYNYTLSPKETESQTFDYELKFGWFSNVTDVKLGSADCAVTSVYVY
jgi:hypothetical protein